MSDKTREHGETSLDLHGPAGAQTRCGHSRYALCRRCRHGWGQHFWLRFSGCAIGGHIIPSELGDSRGGGGGGAVLQRSCGVMSRAWTVGRASVPSGIEVSNSQRTLLHLSSVQASRSALKQRRHIAWRWRIPSWGMFRGFGDASGNASKSDGPPSGLPSLFSFLHQYSFLFMVWEPQINKSLEHPGTEMHYSHSPLAMFNRILRKRRDLPNIAHSGPKVRPTAGRSEC